MHAGVLAGFHHDIVCFILTPIKSCGEGRGGNCQLMSFLYEEVWVEMTHLNAVGHCSPDCFCASYPRRVHCQVAWSNR